MSSYACTNFEKSKDITVLSDYIVDTNKMININH